MQGPRSWLKKYAKPLVALAVIALGYGSYAIYNRSLPYEWAGTVETRTVAVGSRTGGRVKEVFVREGQDVKAGQKLVQLEVGPHEAQMALAEAELEGAEAALARLLHGSRNEEIAQASARIAESRAVVAQAHGRKSQEERELARLKSLFDAKSISLSEYESKRAAVQAAQGALAESVARTAEAQAALKLLTAGAREEDVRAARAVVAAAKSKVAMMDEQLKELTIVAPRDARVETLTVRPGSILSSDSTAVTLVEPQQLYVRIYVPEPQLGKIAVGQKVPVYVDSYPGRAFAGVVEHINQVGEFTPRSLQTVEERTDQVFAARVLVTDGERDLRAGMTAFLHVRKR